MIRMLLVSSFLVTSFTTVLTAQMDSQEETKPTEAEQSQTETDEPPLSPNMKKEGEEDTSRVTDLPLLEELTIPSAAELLTGQKVAWIILDNQRVIVSRPIKPRPRTLEIQANRLFELRTNGIPGDPAKRDAFEKQVYNLRRIRGGFIDGGAAPEFLVLTSRIDKIWHHEDLLLKRADLLMNEKKFPEAYELLFTLQNIDSNWPGLAEANHRFIFLNASNQLESGEIQLAFTKLEQLHSLDPDYPELDSQLILAAGQLIDQSLHNKDHRRARHFLHRLESILPNSEVTQQHSSRFKSLSTKLLNRAVDSAEPGQPREATLLAKEAMEVWPYSLNLDERETYNTLVNNYQILRVGVLEPAGHSPRSNVPSAADERARSLTSRKLFEIQSFDDTPHYRTALIEQWEPTELGRNLDLRLRSTFSYWSSQQPLTALELASQLQERVSPDSDLYNERLGGFIERIEVLEPYRLEIRFHRTPLSPEAVLSLPLDENSSKGGEFVEFSRSDRQISFVRSISEPAQVPQRHVAEILEVAYENREEVLRAMFRGEIDYIPDLPVHHAARLNDSAEWVIRKYQVPQTHILQFRQSSLLGKSSELRRALLYAMNRRSLLSEQILRGAPEVMGRTTTSVFPQQSRAYSSLVGDVSPDPLVARSLTLAAQKAAGGRLPPFRMSVPHDPSLEPALQRMLDDWKRVGIDVEIISSEDPQPENWDIAYRIVTLTQPLSDLWPFLTRQPHSRVADLQVLPGWLRQELIQLELATNWNAAREQLHKLHESLWSEVFYLPLWEVERYAMSRRHLTGLPDQPLSPYQQVNRWVVNPWFDQSKP